MLKQITVYKEMNFFNKKIFKVLSCYMQSINEKSEFEKH